MWNPASPSRSALGLVMAAAVALLGSALMLKASRSFPALTGGVPDTGQPGVLVLAVVILLAATGAVLVVLAGKEYLELRRHPRAR